MNNALFTLPFWASPLTKSSFPSSAQHLFYGCPIPVHRQSTAALSLQSTAPFPLLESKLNHSVGMKSQK